MDGIEDEVSSYLGWGIGSCEIHMDGTVTY